jgi:mono/diheme cytochrome c family protein
MSTTCGERRRDHASRMAIVLVSVAWLVASRPAVDAAQPPGTPTPASPAAGNAEHGRRVYRDVFCYACHGTEGQGGRDGVRLAGSPPSLSVFRAYLRKPAGNMPAYTARVLSEDDLLDIYAFLRSLPKPVSANTIPLLQK